MNATQTSASSSASQQKIGDRVLGSLQNIGRSLMLPIAVLPAAALLLRLGQDDMLQLVGLTQQQLPWLSAAGDAIFANLPMIFAVGIAVGLTGGEGVAGLAAVIGFLVFTSVFNTVIPQVDGKPDPRITTGALGGLLIGLTTTGLYKRFHDFRLPDYLAFFGGRRFVPIITALVSLILGLIFGFIWPPINTGISAGGNWIVSLGPIGTGVYGFLNRLLVFLGLHHILNFFFWQQLGEFTAANGKIVHGDLQRYFAGDPTAGGFMSGFFPIMMFGLPAACLAMIRHARVPKVAAGILLSAAFASFLTGITEPIEFSFMFVAPVLYLVHAILTGTAMAISTLLDIKIGFGFSAGFIDYALNFGKSNTSNALLVLVVGLVYGVLYYFLFSFFIKAFNLATPGRGNNVITEEEQAVVTDEQKAVESKATPSGKSADDVQASNILVALGGKENVETVEGCITRLRLFVKDSDVIDDGRLKELGASGIIKRGKIVQVVLGTQSDRIAARIKGLMKSETPVEK